MDNSVLMIESGQTGLSKVPALQKGWTHFDRNSLEKVVGRDSGYFARIIKCGNRLRESKLSEVQ